MLNELEIVPQIFDAMLARFGPDDSWTQSAVARDADDLPVDYDSSDATCWCLTGALTLEVEIAVGAELQRLGIHDKTDGMIAAQSTATRVRKVLSDVLRRASIVSWNDEVGRTVQEVRTACRRARDRAREERDGHNGRNAD